MHCRNLAKSISALIKIKFGQEFWLWFGARKAIISSILAREIGRSLHQRANENDINGRSNCSWSNEAWSQLS